MSKGFPSTFDQTAVLRSLPTIVAGIVTLLGALLLAPLIPLRPGLQRATVIGTVVVVTIGLLLLSVLLGPLTRDVNVGPFGRHR